MSECDECMQAVYNRAEALMDTLDLAEGLIRAADYILSDARKQATAIARATMTATDEFPD